MLLRPKLIYSTRIRCNQIRLVPRVLVGPSIVCTLCPHAVLNDTLSWTSDGSRVCVQMHIAFLTLFTLLADEWLKFIA